MSAEGIAGLARWRSLETDAAAGAGLAVVVVDANRRVVESSAAAQALLGVVAVGDRLDELLTFHDPDVAGEDVAPYESTAGHAELLTTTATGRHTGARVEVVCSSASAAADRSHLVLVPESDAERTRLLALSAEDARRQRDTLDAVLRAVAHDGRGMVAALSQLAMFLPHVTDDREELLAIGEAIVSEAHQLVELFSVALPERIAEIAEAAPTGLAPVVAVAAERIDGLDVDIDVGMVSVRADPVLVERIIDNILRNAQEAGARRMRVSAHVDADQGEIVVRFEDDGVGIIEGAERLIFEPGVSASTEPTRGFGLFVVARLAEALGGRVWAQHLPVGAAFQLALPAVEASPAAPGERSAVDS